MIMPMLKTSRLHHWFGLFAALLLSLGTSTALADFGDEPAGFGTPPPEEKGVLGGIKRLFGGSSTEQNPFLRPEQAFILSVDVKDPYTVVVRWNIADGYYLYRDKFKFEFIDTDAAAIIPSALPRGVEKEDESFGLMEVYFKEIEIPLPINRSIPAPSDVTLKVGYQGCAEKGFCYPPMTRDIALSLPAATTPPPIAPSTTTPPNTGSGFVSEQDRYARSLSDGNILLSMLMFFGLGLLLTFTPCVFPMIPILSSIIAGQGSNITTGHAFRLSLTYVLAMALTYTAIGVIAGLFGANLQAAFQNPWILSTFAAVFVLLSLSMFGFYELQIPQSIQTRLAELSNKQQGGTYAGVGIMGLLSALIVGPCVAAPLAGALIYIGQSGDAVLGGAALFALSMGMGAPLLAIGTSAGKLLPKAGPWMDAVKAVFGVLLLAVAIWMLERIIPGPVALALWALLFVISAVYLGALDRLPDNAHGWRKLWKGLGVACLIYGGALLMGAATGGDDMLQPLAKLKGTGTSGEQHGLAFERIKDLDDLNQALKVAQSTNTPVMLDFYADWCVACKELERYTFSQPGVQDALRGVTLLQADVTANDALDQALMEEFGLFGPPSILFFDTTGQELRQYRLVGFVNGTEFENLARAAFNHYQ